ncbi:MAG TPA: tetratricopeptide repeat protein [Pyrinomonadaceae bacterium]|jgi:tetratricopeptide (TPR) repeat protein
MKMFCSKAAKIIVFLALSGFAAQEMSAQKINDDLQTPKTTPKKIAKPLQAKKKPVKIVKKTKNPTTPTNTPVTTQPVVVQTPAEIFKRFMDFQQSESVTAKDWESVVTQTNAAMQTNPGDATMKAQLFVAQGQLAFLRGDFSSALIQFNAASDALPNSALPQYGIGKVYLATKQPNEAENAFEKAVKTDKNFALAYKGLGDAMTAQGKTKSAQEYYKDAARIGLSGGNGVVASNNQTGNTQNNQPNVSANTPISPYDAELNEAKKLTVRKKWQASLDKLTTLSKTNPTADIYIAIGDNYIGLKQLLSAQQAFRKATEINPNSAVGFFKLGSALFELNEFQAASEAFEKSLILDQQGTTINRQLVRKWADKASERAKNSKEGKKKFLGIGLL